MGQYKIGARSAVYKLQKLIISKEQIVAVSRVFDGPFPFRSDNTHVQTAQPTSHALYQFTA